MSSTLTSEQKSDDLKMNDGGKTTLITEEEEQQQQHKQPNLSVNSGSDDSGNEGTELHPKFSSRETDNKQTSQRNILNRNEVDEEAPQNETEKATMHEGDAKTRAAIKVGMMLFQKQGVQALKDHEEKRIIIPDVPIEGPIKQRIYHIGYPNWMILLATLIMLVLIGAVVNELVRLIR